VSSNATCDDNYFKVTEYFCDYDGWSCGLCKGSLPVPVLNKVNSLHIFMSIPLRSVLACFIACRKEKIGLWHHLSVHACPPVFPFNCRTERLIFTKCGKTVFCHWGHSNLRSFIILRWLTTGGGEGVWNYEMGTKQSTLDMGFKNLKNTKLFLIWSLIL
jgi:hypothetical protein